MKHTKTVETADSKVGKRGRDHYTHAKADARQAKRHDEAEERNAYYRELPLADKIKRVTKRGGSKKELTRLMALKEAAAISAKAVKVAAEVATVPVEEVKVKKAAYRKVKKS